MDNKVIVNCQMLIRKPIDEVFEAFVDPNVTTKFWFTDSTGRLQKGQSVTWHWEMYNATINVNVVDLIENQSIKTTWNQPENHVDYLFQKMKNGTLVTINSYGYIQKGEELLSVINDNVGGFTTVLDGCKAWLEHGILLNLIEDKFPSE